MSDLNCLRELLNIQKTFDSLRSGSTTEGINDDVIVSKETSLNTNETHNNNNGDDDDDDIQDDGVSIIPKKLSFHKSKERRLGTSGALARKTTTASRKQSLDNLWKVEMYKPLSSELNVLITRSFKQIWRRPLLLRLQLALAIIAALLSIVMFNNMERNIAGVQNRLGFFFFQLAFFGFAGISFCK